MENQKTLENVKEINNISSHLWEETVSDIESESPEAHLDRLMMEPKIYLEDSVFEDPVKPKLSKQELEAKKNKFLAMIERHKERDTIKHPFLVYGTISAVMIIGIILVIYLNFRKKN